MTRRSARFACRSDAVRRRRISPRRYRALRRRDGLRLRQSVAMIRRCRIAASDLPNTLRGAFMNVPIVRLTSLAHGGGCGCKLAPSVLRQLLADQPLAHPYRQLLVGTETGNDAAVWQLDDETCIIATTDFFMPMVDDPFDFGRIAATNAISDVYAMGGKPIMALAILGMPVDKVPPDIVRDILRGGSHVCATAGIPIAGGHSIDAPEPIYGLAVIG